MNVIELETPGTPGPRLGILSVKDTISSDQAGAYLGVAGATLRDWKCQRIRPPFVQLNARVVRYRRSDLEQFIAAHRVVPKVRSIGRFAHAPVHAAKKSVSLL